MEIDILPRLKTRVFSSNFYSLLNHWFRITAEVNARLAADHAKRVAARHNERQLITVAVPPA